MSKLVEQEFIDLKDEQTTAVEVAKQAVNEAHVVRTERNALARKSAILVLDNPPDEKLAEVMEQVDRLAKELEDTTHRYKLQVWLG